MATTITIAEQLVPTTGVSLTHSLPANVLNLDVHITSTDWASLSGTVDFLVECNIGAGGAFQRVLEIPDAQLGVLSPKGNGLPRFAIGAAALAPATQIRLTITPTTPVHIGLVVTVN